MIAIFRRAVGPVAAAALIFLAGCSDEFKISYDSPIDAGVSRGWRVVDVRVAVPEELSVSEQKSIAPQADIVWREDPPGDRRAQVAAIVRAGVQQGASGLNGSRRVRIDVTVQRFHALTFEAENRLVNAGVHNVDFVAQVVDVSTGAVLAGPTAISADVAALVGIEARTARENGAGQKVRITATIRQTIAGWLGIARDPRGSFNRPGL